MLPEIPVDIWLRIWSKHDSPHSIPIVCKTWSKMCEGNWGSMFRGHFYTSDNWSPKEGSQWRNMYFERLSLQRNVSQHLEKCKEHDESEFEAEGASPDDIRRVEKELDVILPADLVESLLCANGFTSNGVYNFSCDQIVERTKEIRNSLTMSDEEYKLHKDSLSFPWNIKPSDLKKTDFSDKHVFVMEYNEAEELMYSITTNDDPEAKVLSLWNSYEGWGNEVICTGPDFESWVAYLSETCIEQEESDWIMEREDMKPAEV